MWQGNTVLAREAFFLLSSPPLLHLQDNQQEKLLSGASVSLECSCGLRPPAASLPQAHPDYRELAARGGLLTEAQVPPSLLSSLLD